VDLQQVKKDRENEVLISPSTWSQVLETALAASEANERLVATLNIISKLDIVGPTTSEQGRQLMLVRDIASKAITPVGAQ